MNSFKVTLYVVVVIVSINSGSSHPGFAAVSHGGDEDSGDSHVIDYHAYPKYQYNYGVNDPHTGDIKNHWEERDGGVVKGSYSLHEADGTIRIVEYTADKHNGFNAVVHRSGTAQHGHPGYKH